MMQHWKSVFFVAFLLFINLPARAISLHPPASTIPASYFGLNVESPNLHQRAAPAKSWRLWDASVGWRDLEPQKGQWDFSRLDAFVNRAQKEGAEINYVFGMTPAWAAARPDEPGLYGQAGMASEPRNITDWKTFVQQLAHRYKGRIRYWELWNEANDPGYYSGSREKLIEMAKVAYSILKATDPGNIVLSPSVTHQEGLKWLDQYLAHGGGDAADIISYHFYVFNGRPEDMIQLAAQVREVMRKEGQQGKPLWNTESGWLIESAQHKLEPLSHVGPVLPAQRSADFLARAYLLNWAAGVSRLYWYAWDDYNFGLLESDGATVKPAGRAFQQVQKWMAGARMTGCSLIGTSWSCSLRQYGKAAIIAWSTSSHGSLHLPENWRAVMVSHLNGSTERLRRGASIALTAAPILVMQLEQ